MENLTKLYALNKDNSIQVWYGESEADTFTVYYGKLGGKIQSKKTKCTAKNVGRANETTPDQQAILELEACYRDQIRKGYFENLEDVKVDTTQAMLAADYLKKPKAVVWPCDGMRKLDGLRCITVFENDKPKFISRGNKEYPVPEHLSQQLIKLRELSGISQFDGELYLHGTPLQRIVSLTKKPQEGSEDLTYQIFDVQSNKPWKVILSKDKDWTTFGDSRYTDLYNNVGYYLRDKSLFSHIDIVESATVNNETEAKELIGKYMQEGYEGIILRNYKGLYEYGQRSNDLIKYKFFQDIEAKVIGCTIDKNNEGVLQCQLQTGVTFSAKMLGTKEFRAFENQQKMIGKFVTVKFQQYTVDMVPQFPVIICEREVDHDTWSVLE